MYVIDLSSPVVESLSENRISEFKLFENYPNPFNLSTRLQYQLPKESVVFLKLFDLLGREVITFENGIVKETGSHSVLWDGKDASGCIVPSGIYILRIQAGDYIEQKKLVLTK
jgi:flagellar hook assembly protein FlgD